MYFNPPQEPIVVIHTESLNPFSLGHPKMGFELGSSFLTETQARGLLPTRHLSWDLSWTSEMGEVAPFPWKILYTLPFPKAKVFTPVAIASFNGTVGLKSETLTISNWRGSIGHNWGKQHTRHYTWIQCSEFENAESTYCEAALTHPPHFPALSYFYLQTPDTIIHSTTPLQLKTLTSNPTHWQFEAHIGPHHLTGTCAAPPSDFVTLDYPNPDGTKFICRNSKLAHLELTLQTPRQKPHTLTSPHHCALEMIS